jgi:hypothetical protein
MAKKNDMDAIYRQMAGTPLQIAAGLAERLAMELPEDKRLAFIGRIQELTGEITAKIEAVYTENISTAGPISAPYVDHSPSDKLE